MIKFIDKDGNITTQDQHPETLNFSALERYRARKALRTPNPEAVDENKTHPELITASGK